MRVSLIIPTFNSGRLVVEAIASALAQTLPPDEIIVIDDGSTDDTQERLAQFSPPVRCIRQENQGVAAARNRGLAEATGDVIAFLDADDVWFNRKLELQLAALAEHPEICMLGTRVINWPAGAAPSVAADTDLPIGKVLWERLVVRNYFVTSSVIVRRSALEKVGGFDPALRGPEDYDLWIRLAETAQVGNLHLPLTGYRLFLAGSLGKQVATMEAGMRRILEKLDERKAWHGRWLLRRKAQSHFYASCAYMHRESGNSALAARRLVRSLICFPLPYRRSETRMPLIRLRLLATSLFARNKSAPEISESMDVNDQSGTVIP